ncbi:MAG: hypothetical protein HKN35_08990 [Woeseia sp.]|nr:hypothetical protein [Woeseia sp.]NNE61017.1 hypothetical protein [Woeseia sp.]NNL53619.1 hypothetical protein [Woeseia sp.]
MIVIRYLLYFVGVAFLTWLLTLIEISSPGSLKLQVFTHADDVLGTSEYSPVETVQLGFLAICGMLYGWVAQYSPQQRPVALTFAGVAAMFFIRELDFFLDRYIIDNFWQVLVAVIAAVLIVYTWRHQKRLRLAWTRIWPSPGLTLLFAGFLVHFAFLPFVGHEPLWEAMLGDDYRRIIKITVEEFIELAGYFLWLVGTIEYTLQSRAYVSRDPQQQMLRRRKKRRRRSDRRF